MVSSLSIAPKTVAPSANSTGASESTSTVPIDITHLEADYGFLPQDHIIVQNLQARIKRLFPDLRADELPEVRVLASLGMGANASYHEGGYLVITPELFTVLKYEEELDAVLKHEGIHHRHEHHAELKGISTKSPDRVGGARRIFEYEADVISFLEMADQRSNTNPFGYISLLETLLELPNGAQMWDSDHGRLSDRLLNLRLIVGSYELAPGVRPLEHLSERPLTPIGSEIVAAAKAIRDKGGKIGQILRSVPANPRDFDTWESEMKGAVAQAKSEGNLPLLIAATNALAPRLQTLLQNDASNSAHSTNSIRYQATYKLLTDLLSAIESTVGQTVTIQPGLLAGVLLSPISCKTLNRTHQGTGLRPLKQASDFIKMANSLTLEELSNIPATIQKLIDSGFPLPGTSCSRLVRFLASYLLKYNAAFDYPKGHTSEDKPDVAHFWKSVTPVLSEAYGVDTKYLRWSNRWHNLQLSEAIVELANVGLQFRAEFNEEGTQSAEPHSNPLLKNEEAALRELLLQLRELENDRHAELSSPPVLKDVGQEMVSLQERADAFTSEQLTALLYDSIRAIGSLPAEFYTNAQVTPDDNVENPPTFAVDSKQIRVTTEKITKSIVSRIIARLDNSDLEQVLQGVQLIRYLPSEIGRIEFNRDFFTKLFSKLSLEDLLELPKRIAHLRTNEKPEYPWSEFPARDKAFYLIVEESYAAISSLRADHLLRVSDSSTFYRLLESTLRDLNPDLIPLESRSKLFRHAVTMLKKVSDEERPYYGYLTSALILDVALNQRIRTGFLAQLAQSKPIAEMIQLTTSTICERGPKDFLRVLATLDKKATLPEEHKLLFDTLTDLTASHREDAIDTAGDVVIAELLSEFTGFERRKRATEILLQSHQDDAPLRDEIARAWFHLNKDQIEVNLEQFARQNISFDDFVELLKQTDLLSEESLLSLPENGDLEKQLERLQAPTPECMLQSIYTLSEQERMVLTRELLLPPKTGLLTTDRGKYALHQMLISSAVDETGGLPIVSDAARALLTVGRTDRLAEGLIPLIAERICQTPHQSLGWNHQARLGVKKNRLVEQFIDNLRRASAGESGVKDAQEREINWIKDALCSSQISDKRRAHILNKYSPTPGATFPESFTARQTKDFFVTDGGVEWLSSLRRTSLRQYNYQVRGEVMSLLLKPAVIKSIERAMSRPYRSGQDNVPAGEEESIKTLLTLSKPPQAVATGGKRNSIDFMADFAPKLGTTTVRMAQVGAQLLPLSPGDTLKLSNVFDNTKPQLACSAWSTFSRAEPDIASRLTQFGPRIGGGSLYSVFYAIHREHGPIVVKVLVPQAAHRAASVVELAEATQQEMARYNPLYASGGQLIELSKGWVMGELGDTKFTDDDDTFRIRFNDKPYAGLKIHIPRRIPTRNATIQVEEFIDGHNLTAIGVLEPHLAKRAVAAGFQFYISQITGTLMDNIARKSVLILADISPGNVRITSDGQKLAILDRTFYQHITFDDRLFLKNLLTANDAATLALEVTRYLQREGSTDMPTDVDTARQKLQHLLQERLKDGMNDSLISCVTVDAYSAGFTFPLRLQLLARGMAAWRHMALSAGFKSLEEARSYRG